MKAMRGLDRPAIHKSFCGFGVWRPLATRSSRVRPFGSRRVLGEAIVPGHGMPLRDDVSEEGRPQDRIRGDLIVKFAIELPKRSQPDMSVGGPIPIPPIGLLVPDPSTGSLAMDAVGVLLTSSVLPAGLARVARQRLLHQSASTAAATPFSYPQVTIHCRRLSRHPQRLRRMPCHSSQLSWSGCV